MAGLLFFQYNIVKEKWDFLEKKKKKVIKIPLSLGKDFLKIIMITTQGFFQKRN